MALWWEKEVVKFECKTDCFQCCSKPGVVYFDKEDIENASKFLSIKAHAFKDQYLKCENDVWLLEVETDRPCAFLSSSGCAIHPAKPKQCRTFPFWPENMTTRARWSSTAEECPGIGLGPQISPRSIASQLMDQ
ncbi:MAG: YkgJ family cysteine cluster protein [Candidatus Nitrohelix vancouverensis]|uniref:YkgJ family cysteine cluster protein n=1 Tax=Candidatus Nitrohelix vancouverensis TaxID=2705534 RepID=A0A7T0G4L9_9BACT|nr:MAG: YkgJ family cysteine cluster protein [Candidatus Nitrohelix vancouverensis]